MSRALPLALACLLLMGTACACAQAPDDPVLDEEEDASFEDEDDEFYHLPPSAPAAPPGSAAGGAAAAGMAGVISILLGLYFVFFACIWLVAIAAWVGKILAIYDCARRDFDDPGTRAIWCVLIVLTNLVGALIYYFLVYRKGDPPYQVKRPPVSAPPLVEDEG